MRQELWKYRRVFDVYEQDWSSAPFKKLDINMISNRVIMQHLDSQHGQAFSDTYMYMHAHMHVAGVRLARGVH